MIDVNHGFISSKKRSVGVAGMAAAPRPASKDRIIVFLAKEAGLTVMPPLHDAQGNTIKMNAGAGRHVNT